MRTTIYCGNDRGEFQPWVDRHGQPMNHNEAWWFPEIDYGCRGGAVPRHPRRVIELVPDMIGKTIVTMSEHIVLAFQQLVRKGEICRHDLELHCGCRLIYVGDDGDLDFWPGGFFPERLGLLR
jgi:hypothetical protein